MKTRQHTKATNQPGRKRQNRWVIIYLVIILSIVALSLFFFVWPDVTSKNKDTIIGDMSRALDSVTFSGTKIYSKEVDNGCRRTLKSRYDYTENCSLTIYRVYLNNGNLWDDLNRFDRSLSDNGFQRILFSNQTQKNFDDALSGARPRDALRYINAKVPATIFVLEYDSDVASSYRLSELMTTGPVLLIRHLQYPPSFNII